MSELVVRQIEHYEPSSSSKLTKSSACSSSIARMPSIMRKVVGYQFSGGFLHSKLNAHAGVGCHVDECIKAEQFDFVFQKKVEPGLCYTEHARGFLLCKPALVHELLDAHHHVGAQQQVVRLVGREADVLKYIPGAFLNLHSFRHFFPRCASISRYRCRAMFTSGKLVACDFLVKACNT